MCIPSSIAKNAFYRNPTAFLTFSMGNASKKNLRHILARLPDGTTELMEPSQDEEKLGIKDVTVALLPGLGFDPTGGRIGRGNGGYDIWLKELRAKNPAARVWGIALDCQMVDRVPRETHDQTVDVVVTPRGIIDPATGSREPR